ncbi:uncharacterized protein LOC143577357 [Bidens hawaiensis]|uniref:uncharacterized protein LOC143577357 n=1 Tax=Bidens hawaiensis TaxID=980011 RepID=UPI00404A57C8
MGCCASTNTPPPSPQFHRHLSKSSRAPPPVDEETVKEVLSETTNPNHFNKIQDQPTKINPKPKIRNQPDHNHEDINFSGEVSEICSNMSESVSNTTFDKDYELLRRKVANRSPAKLRNRQNNNNSGELRGVKNYSPVRGKQQSPGRVRSGSDTNNRGSGFGSTGRQRPAPGSGQVSRSRSPANRTVARGGGGGVRNGVGRSPSAKKTENSLGRVGPQRVMKADMDTGMEMESGYGWDVTDRNVDDESLDNPLVSLECFIFL